MKRVYELGKSFIYTQGDRLKKPNHGYGNSSGEKFYPDISGCITISKSNCAVGVPIREKTWSQIECVHQQHKKMITLISNFKP